MEKTNNYLPDLYAQLIEATRHKDSVRRSFRGREDLIKKSEDEIDQVIASIKEEIAQAKNPAPAEVLTAIPWIGTDVDFADLILELRDKGYIETATQAEALRLAAPHFGLELKGLRQGREKRIDRELAGNFGCIPTNPRKKK